jgi:hypothetical protein
MSIVSSDQFNYSTLTDMVAAGGVLTGLQIGLFTNDLAPSNLTLLSDLTEASFDGYARQNITWDSIFRGQSGAYHVNSQLVQFASTDSTNPQICYGYFVVTGTGSTATLLFTEMFAESITFGQEYNSALISVQYTQGGTDEGDATVIS